MAEPDSRSRVEPKPIGAVGASLTGLAVKRRNSTGRWIIEFLAIVTAVFILTLLIQQIIARDRGDRSYRNRRRGPGEAPGEALLATSDFEQEDLHEAVTAYEALTWEAQPYLRQVPVGEVDSGSLVEPTPIGTAEGSPPVAVAKRRNSATRWVVEVVVIVAAAFILALLVQQFIVKPFAIPSPSMEPTLVQGDRVLVNRLVYHFRPPHRGDVIVFHPPGRPGSDPFIKRVVAVGGDTIAVHDGLLYVNGVGQDEPFIKERPIVGDFPETTIEPGYVWAMGDNRNNSGDSRVFGPVPVKSIMGEAFAVYWPLGRIAGL